MWYWDAEYGAYWLVNDAVNLALPTVYPDMGIVHRRPIAGDDVMWDQYILRNLDGRNYNYWVVQNPIFLTESAKPESVTNIEFPETVTLDSLAKFFKKDDKKANILLDVHTILQKTGPGSFCLLVDGNTVVAWTVSESEGKLTFYARNSLSVHQQEALQKYLGSAWTMSIKDGIVGLESVYEKWIPASQIVWFTMNGHIIDRKQSDTIFNPILDRYNALLGRVNAYLDTITPERIRKATAGMHMTTHSIFTRCNYCQCCNGPHLEAHIAREDLDTFLIFSAYEGYGPTIEGGARRLTWELIANPTDVKVNAFKAAMGAFLLEALRSGADDLVFAPSLHRQGVMRWTTQNRIMEVVGGAAMALSRHGEEVALGDGEWLARERQGAERRPRPMGDEDGRLEAVGLGLVEPDIDYGHFDEEDV